MAFRKPQGYDKTQSYGGGRQLPAGGYVCVIKNAREDRTQGGLDVLRVQIDIAEGEYRGYYAERYNSDKERSQNPKWKGILNVWMYAQDGVNASRALNAFGNALDDAGAELWTPNDELNIRGIIGKPIGIIFRREEFVFSDGSGKTGWVTRPLYTKPASDIRAGDFQIPEDKPLQQAAAPEPAFSATEDDIPF